jgi:hypothetical protein
MNVEIVSIQAAIHGRPSITWHGDVPVGFSGHIGQTNEALFRFFNRVDEADNDKLAAVGYFLPSLSVGDLLHWGSKTWRVAGAGFEAITGSDDYVLALTAYTLRSMTGGEAR